MGDHEKKEEETCYDYPSCTLLIFNTKLPLILSGTMSMIIVLHGNSIQTARKNKILFTFQLPSTILLYDVTFFKKNESPPLKHKTLEILRPIFCLIKTANYLIKFHAFFAFLRLIFAFLIILLSNECIRV